MTTRLPISTFHDLSGDRAPISFPPALFERGMTMLRERSFGAVSLVDAAALIQHGERFPERSMVITFDDGYRSVYEHAFPVLQRLGLPATVFLTVGRGRPAEAGVRLPSLEGRTMLSWAEIREMHAAGIEFGAHTLTHPDLTSLPPDRVETEMRESKSVIEDALGGGVRTFCYPYGRHNKLVRTVARGLFACACSDKLGLATIHSDTHALERVDAYYLRTDRLFGLVPSSLFPWYVSARAVPRRLRRALTGGPKGGASC